MSAKVLKEALNTLREGEGLVFKVEGLKDEKLAVHLLDPDKIKQINLMTGVRHIICVALREKGVESLHELEMQMFKPGTAANDQFTLYAVRWQEIIWWVASVPIHRCSYVEDFFDARGLKLRKTVPGVINIGRGAVMMSLSRERLGELPGANWFPIQENTYTVEQK